MRWRGRTESSHVEDRRGRTVRAGGIAGMGGLGIVVALVYLLMGGNPLELLQMAGEQGTQYETGSQSYRETDEEKELRQFSAVVLRETEQVWHDLFARNGMKYVEPTLTLYSGSVQSGCGFASSGSGPFYCPLDRKVYLDLQFYHEMKHRFSAPGDFAMAYVIAHEVGHHVQNLLGILDKYHALRGKMSEREFNTYTVKLELQADYMAGVVAHHIQNKGLLDEGDFEEAINAAGAVGDDTIQMQSQGYIIPENFTHGTADQRMHWFRKGFVAGDLSQGNTFQ